MCKTILITCMLIVLNCVFGARFRDGVSVDSSGECICACSDASAEAGYKAGDVTKRGRCNGELSIWP